MVMSHILWVGLFITFNVYPSLTSYESHEEHNRHEEESHHEHIKEDDKGREDYDLRGRGKNMNKDSRDVSPIKEHRREIEHEKKYKKYYEPNRTLKSKKTHEKKGHIKYETSMVHAYGEDHKFQKDHKKINHKTSRDIKLNEVYERKIHEDSENDHKNDNYKTKQNNQYKKKSSKHGYKKEFYSEDLKNHEDSGDIVLKKKYAKSNPKEESSGSHQKEESSGSHQKEESSGSHQKEESSGSHQKEESSGSHQKEESYGSHQKDESSGSHQKKKRTRSYGKESRAEGEEKYNEKESLSNNDYNLKKKNQDYKKEDNKEMMSRNDDERVMGREDSVDYDDYDEYSYDKIKDMDIVKAYEELYGSMNDEDEPYKIHYHTSPSNGESYVEEDHYGGRPLTIFIEKFILTY